MKFRQILDTVSGALWLSFFNFSFRHLNREENASAAARVNLPDVGA